MKVKIHNRFPLYRDDESYSRIVLMEEILVVIFQQEERPLGFKVPEGFQSDLASIPRIFLPIFPKQGRNKVAAIIHDWLYTTKRYDKEMSDKIFFYSMVALGVKPWRRYLMYQAVKWFGASAWKGDG